MRSLDILVIFRLDLGQVSFINLSEIAFETRCLPFLPLATRFTTFWLGHAQKSKLWGFLEFFFIFPFSHFLFFFLQWLNFYWACLRFKKTSKKASSSWSSQVQQQEILLWVFHSTFWAFLCTSQAPFGRSLWSGHHWKYLFLLQKFRLDDVNFGQKWWRQQWEKAKARHSRFTGGTWVNWLIKFFHSG